MKKSFADLMAIRNKTLNQVNLRVDREEGIRIVVGMATCGIAAGARPVLKAFSEEHPDAKLVLLSMEERSRMLNGIEVWPVTQFLQRLWGGKVLMEDV